MIKRALLFGVGQKYKETNKKWPFLNLVKDLDILTLRLRQSNWDSIDVIDDEGISDSSNLVGENLFPITKNVVDAALEIISHDTQVLLMYYSGHGKFFKKFYMVNYDEIYFQNPIESNLQMSTLFTENSYLDLCNRILHDKPNVLLVSIIDCCFAGCIIDRHLTTINHDVSNHIILCAVDGHNKARGPDQGGPSFFTSNICSASSTSKTYNELIEEVNKISFSVTPKFYCPSNLEHKLHPF